MQFRITRLSTTWDTQQKTHLKMRLLFYMFLVSANLLPQLIYSQDTLKLSSFKNILIENHPLIQKAEMFDLIAESYLMKGQGALDPKLYSDFDSKQFEDKNYFQRWNSSVKIPTRYPIDFSAGYENNNGDFLNLENSVPSNGLLYGTLNISVLRGLIFDEQRFQLAESELLSDKSKIQKELIVREVILQGLNAYLEWTSAYNYLEVQEDYYQRIFERHEFIKQLFENGDKPEIDTIESRISLNTAETEKIFATDQYFLKTQKLNLFLWDGDEPLVLAQSVVPESLLSVISDLEEESIFLNPSFQTDPIIRKSNIEIEQIFLENRLEKEWLKPQLDIKLNTIHNLGDSDLAYTYNINDYKLGASLELPIRNRKVRGQIKLNEALIDQIKYDQAYYLLQLENKFIGLKNSQELKLQALEITKEKLENSKILLNAEKIKFDMGESSVFLLNNRERALLDSNYDYIKNLKALGLILNQIIFLKLGQV